MRIRWQPEPKAEELLTGDRRWQPFWPDFRLIRPVVAATDNLGSGTASGAKGPPSKAATQKASALHAFRQEVPPVIATAVENFPSNQWAVMTLLHKQPLAVDLALSTPALAYALGNCDLIKGTLTHVAARQALCHCFGKQRGILEWLGFPGTEPMIRLLRKIPMAHITPSFMRRLQTVIAADCRVMSLLRHVPVLDAPVLELVSHPSVMALVTPKLLLEVSGSETDLTAVPLAGIILSGIRIRDEVAPRRAVRPFERVAEIHEFGKEMDREHQAHLRRMEIRRQELAAQEHQRLMEEQAEWRANWMVMAKKSPYPAPPFPGTVDIVPITSAEQLMVEGTEQNHCVASHIDRVKAGDTYIYRVMAPERATLSIYRVADGSWERLQLRGKSNIRVRAGTARAVAAWLHRCNESLRKV